MKYINKHSSVKIFLFFASMSFFLFFSYLNFSFNNKIYNVNNKILIIKEGTTVSKNIKYFKIKKIIDSQLRFKILSYLYDAKPRFINGKYEISKHETEYTLLKKIVNGNLLQESITIIEGSTYSEIIKILKNQSTINSMKFNHNYEKIFLSSTNYTSAEGLCFPDTYKFSSGISLEDFLANCFENMETILLKYWRNRDFSLPYSSPYEMLIMASIIEKETSIASEKPLISSVFINRLKKNMRLQADPTVIYGMKNYKGNISKKDLKSKNEYNTYRIDGLPKTPICSPAESSIEAASKPADSEFLYFVANNEGKHIFSKNYNDHIKAVNKYQK